MVEQEVVLKSNFNKYITIFLILLILLSCKSGISLAGIGSEAITLGNSEFVYDKDDKTSPILDIFPKGKTITVSKSGKDGWLQIGSDDKKGFWIEDRKKAKDSQDIPKGKTPNYDFTIPKSGVSNFNLVKIDERYSFTLTNANTVEVLQRLFKLEKKNITILSDLSPITLNGSALVYEDLWKKIKDTGIFSFELNEVRPFLWAKDLHPNLKKSSLKIESLSNLNDTASYGEANGEEAPAVNTNFAIGLENENSASALSVNGNGILSADNSDFTKYDKLRKETIKISFTKISDEAKEETCGRFYGYVFSESEAAILINIREESCGESGTRIFLLDGNFNILKKNFYKGRRLRILQASLAGDRIFARMDEIQKDATPEKTDIVLNGKGNVLSEKVFSENQIVLYDSDLKREIRFDHSTISIRPIGSQGNTVKETAPIEFRNTYLLEAGEDYLAYGKNNIFYSLSLATGKTQTQFQLSDQYSFVDISKGVYSILSSKESGGTWSVVDLSKRKILYSNYKDSVFRKPPRKIRKFPRDEKFILFNPGESTKSLVFGDNAGNLYKTSLFEDAVSISNIEFKGSGLLYLDTEKGHYYIAVASLVKAGRKIE